MGRFFYFRRKKEMLEIVPAEKDDLILVQEVAHQTWPHTFGKILSPEQIEYMLNWMYSVETLGKQLSEGHQFFLVKEDGKTIGYLGIQVNYEPRKTKIHKVYILPNQQGKGLGKLLFAKAQEVAKANNQDFLQLNVNRENQPAIDFYIHYGFKELRREVIDIGNGYVMDDIVFEYPLH